MSTSAPGAQYPTSEEALRAAGLVRSEIDLRVQRAHLRLLTAHDLFSGHAIDAGTSLLLRAVRQFKDRSYLSTLDIGCGYGPLGLYASRRWPYGAVRLTDRDALAVVFTRVNAVRNGLEVSVVGSLMADGVGGRTSELVISNIPGKAGAPAIELLLAQMDAAVTDDGVIGIVVVAPLGDLVRHTFEQLGCTIVAEHQNQTYLVLLAQRGKMTGAPVPDDSFSAGVYDRTKTTFTLDGAPPLLACTVRGIPEFDTPAFHTCLAWKLLRPLLSCSGDLLVVNPGQGIVPMAARAVEPHLDVHLMSRDLLQLRASDRAVRRLGGTASSNHTVPVLAELDRGYGAALINMGRRDVPGEHAGFLRHLAETGTKTVVIAGQTKLAKQVAKRALAEGWVERARAPKADAAAIELARQP